MNGKRILLGGLVAGVFVNISEAVLNAGILMDDYEAMSESLGLTEASWAMAGYIFGALVFGFAIAWLYAAIRPRFGPGPATAVLAGIVVWVIGSGVPSIWLMAMGLTFGAGATLLAVVWTFVEMVIAGLIAGWFYREAEGV